MVGRAMGKNNAFGDGSPNWNLSFPEGNMTAAELLAYTPHWLKSVDVILRLVNHGGRAVVIAHLISKYRDTAKAEFHPNSACVMMHYAMRRAGNEDWTINTRSNYPQDRSYDENSLYVGDFRPPRVTHPKSVPAKLKCKQSEHSRNAQADPIPFKDLALHVREHPSGADALDLTRCVLYGIEHPEEEWLFPDDFEELVDHLGGPLTITYSHLDKQLFTRYDHLFSAPHPRWRSGPAKGSGKGKKRSRTKTKDQPKHEPSEFYLANPSDSDADHNPEDLKIKIEGEGQTDDEAAYQAATQWLDRFKTMKSTRPSPSNGGRDGAGRSRNDSGPRRSSRRVKKTPVYTEKDEYATDDDEDYTSPRKKRQLNHIQTQLTDEESDFEAKEEPESEEEPIPAFDEEVDELYSNNTSPALNQCSIPHQPQSSLGRVSKSESDTFMQQFELARATASNAHLTPEQISAAAAWHYQPPSFIKPPALSLDRLTVDAWNVHLYAEEGCRTAEQQWASALSFYRFNGGPRTSPPFRELHRLTQPAVWDTDAFAENVRWAQQQYRLYGVDTWTEYDAHLELITSVRQACMWFSEEAICAKIQG